MLLRFSREARALYRSLIDLLFPPRCVTCGHLGGWFCSACQATIEKIHPPICARCGRRLERPTCPFCAEIALRIDGTRAVAFFEGALRQAIHAFKYQKRVELATIFAALIDDYLREHPIPFDVLVPVPLHADRESARGYNQALLLARELQARRGYAVWDDALARVRATRAQMELDAAERRENVRAAFAADARVRNRQILLVDDVCTTGATMDACSVALKQQGAKSVWGLAIARGR